MSTIAALDISTKQIDIVTIDENVNRAQHHRVRLDLTRADATTRARRLRDQMPARTAWPDAGVILIAIEKPYSHQPNGLIPLMVVYGGLLQLIPVDMPLYEMSAVEWRRECGLPQRGPRIKEASLERAHDLWQDRPPTLDHNAADAFNLSWAAREIYHRAHQPLTKGAAA